MKTAKEVTIGYLENMIREKRKQIERLTPPNTEIYKLHLEIDHLRSTVDMVWESKGE